MSQDVRCSLCGVQIFTMASISRQRCSPCDNAFRQRQALALQENETSNDPTRRDETMEKAKRFAQRLTKADGVMAVGVCHPAADSVLLFDGPTGAHDRARVMATATANAAAAVSESNRGLAEIDLRWSGMKALGICRPDVVLAVVAETGHPVLKSLQRMVRRSLKHVYGDVFVEPPNETPAQNAPAPDATVAPGIEA